jgi:Putative peptidoglycan binding domain
MKHILYSLWVGSAILALAASGASAAKPDSKKKESGKRSAQVVSGKARTQQTSFARPRVSSKATAGHSVARPRVSSKASVRRASMRTDRGRTSRESSVATRSKGRASTDVAAKSNGHASSDVATRSKVRTSRDVANRNKVRANRDVATKSSGGASREAAQTRAAQNTAVRTRDAARRNMNVNRQRNLTMARNVLNNRAGDVRIVNNWRNDRFRGANYAAFYNYNRTWHDRWWWDNHHSTVVFVLGGWWYWNAGYWYPAWGYDPYGWYAYDGPIYTGYADLRPDQVLVNVQVQLRDHGYYAGAIDGLMGPQTRAALAAFQADNGLVVTSAVDQPTLQTLGVA